MPRPSRLGGRVGRGDKSEHGPILSPNEGEKDGAPGRSSVTPRTTSREPKAQVSVQTKDANLGHQHQYRGNGTWATSPLASAFIAWMEVKQHSELAQAYSVAEFDLSLVEERGDYVCDETTFSSFVADAENAISREHTLWIARRDRS